ncbi:NUDIX hydrolase [Streptomyces bacillaris]|uniref:NUDIX hydrolase n=1 Tax=Streptomyces bacillaris TaxID=68179 RepID=UPI003460B8D0
MIGEDQVVRELSHYIAAHPQEQMALLPVYDAAMDHSRRRSCTHNQRCPLVVTGAVVVDEQGRALCLRHGGRYALAEAEPEAEDDTLSGAALRLLDEQIGIRDVWTHTGAETAFLVDVTRPGQHPYGPRLRVGIRYLFRAHSNAVSSAVIEAGAAAWVPLSEIGIEAVRLRVESCLVGIQ